MNMNANTNMNINNDANSKALELAVIDLVNKQQPKVDGVANGNKYIISE